MRFEEYSSCRLLIELLEQDWAATKQILLYLFRKQKGFYTEGSSYNAVGAFASDVDFIIIIISSSSSNSSSCSSSSGSSSSGSSGSSRISGSSDSSGHSSGRSSGGSSGRSIGRISGGSSGDNFLLRWRKVQLWSIVLCNSWSVKM